MGFYEEEEEEDMKVEKVGKNRSLVNKAGMSTRQLSRKGKSVGRVHLGRRVCVRKTDGHGVTARIIEHRIYPCRLIRTVFIWI